MNSITYYKVSITREELINKIKNNARIICWEETGLSDPPSLGTIRIMCSDGIAIDATMTKHELERMVPEVFISLIDVEVPLVYCAFQIIIEAVMENYRICAFLDGMDGEDINIDVYTDRLNSGGIYTQKDIDEICSTNNLTPKRGFTYDNGIKVLSDGAQIVESYSNANDKTTNPSKKRS